MSFPKEERAAASKPAGASEMVERVALALHLEESKAQPVEFYYFLARAAIAAMREPTPEMLAAGVRAAASLRPEGAPLVWRAMIDAAAASNGSPSALEARDG